MVIDDHEIEAEYEPLGDFGWEPFCLHCRLPILLIPTNGGHKEWRHKQQFQFPTRMMGH